MSRLSAMKGPRHMAPVLTSRVLCVALVLACLASCGGAGDDLALQRTLSDWFEALHESDFEALARVDASAPLDREGEFFRAWSRAVERSFEEYERARERGTFECDAQGYGIVRAALLGRGAFWEQVERRATREGILLRLRINFGYGDINFRTLSPGTTIYLLGHPLGTVHRIVLGRGERREMDVLEHLEVEVLLVDDPEIRVEGDARYKVSRLTWLPETAEHRTVLWEF